MMRAKNWLFAFLLLGLAFRQAWAEEKERFPPLPPNAALQYWQAFVLMPQLTKEQEKSLDDWKSGPPNEEVRKILDSCKNALDALHRGAKLPSCDWGMNYADGAEMLMPHLQRARDLARTAIRRARSHFEAGRYSAGVDDVLAALALARHASTDATLIGVLVRYAIENFSIDAAAPYLKKLDAASLYRLRAGIEALPAYFSAKMAINFAERNFVRWFIQRLKSLDPAKPDDLVEFITRTSGDKKLTETILKAAGTPPSRDKLIQLAEAVDPYYDEVNRLMDLSWDRYTAAKARFDERIEKAAAINPILGTFFPVIHKVIAAEARTKARFALFKAAIAVAEKGPDVLKDYPDPYGDGPFVYRKLDQGFELKSKLKNLDKVEAVVVVGPSPGK